MKWSHIMTLGLGGFLVIAYKVILDGAGIYDVETLLSALISTNLFTAGFVGWWQARK